MEQAGNSNLIGLISFLEKRVWKVMDDASIHKGEVVSRFIL